MSKKFKAISALAVCAVMMSSVAFTSAAAGNDITVEGESMYNDYIKISCDFDGGLRMYTTNGDPDNPNDNFQKLLYGTNYSTSHTTLNIDGNPCYYDDVHGISGQFDAANKTHVSEKKYKGVDIRQNFTFIKSNATGRDDLVEIKYTLTNNDTVSHEAGVRIMIDTMLGDNDEAPFRIPNVGSVEIERTFSGNDIPEYYQAFDSFENPSVISFGTFDKTSSNKADFVQFISWTKCSSRWDIPTEEGSLIGDSSVTSVWNPKTLNPGETRVYKMYYGLGKFVADTTGELQLAGYGDNTAKINEEQTGYEPSTVTAYLKNSSENVLENVTVTLNTAEEMTLAGGEQTINVGNLSAGEEKQVSWTVNFAPSQVEKTVNYSISAKADNADEKIVNLTTVLPAITASDATPDEPTTAPTTTVEPTTEEPTTTAPVTTEPPTTVEPTTTVPTTVAPTTTPDATSATKPATKDTAVTTNNNNAIQTGSASVAALVLTVLSAAAGIAYFARKRENN